MRPDLVFFGHLGNIDNYIAQNQPHMTSDGKFSISDRDCQVLVRNIGMGGEDIFNIGARKVMHGFLNRFDRFHKLAVKYFPKKKDWITEDFARAWLNDVCKKNFTPVSIDLWPLHVWRFPYTKLNNPHGKDTLHDKPKSSNDIPKSSNDIPKSSNDELEMTEEKILYGSFFFCSGLWIIRFISRSFFSPQQLSHNYTIVNTGFEKCEDRNLKI